MIAPRFPKVTLLVFCVGCTTLNINQFKECECVMEFPLIHFNVFIKSLSGYGKSPNYVFFRQCVSISEILEIVKLLGRRDSHFQIISGKTSPLAVAHFCNYFPGLLKLIKIKMFVQKHLGRQKPR